MLKLCLEGEYNLAVITILYPTSDAVASGLLLGECSV
jgi:hypothetical protein